MPYGLYISAEGAKAQAARLEVLANNLANVDTPGFKRDLAIFQARYAEAIEQGLAGPGAGGIDDVGGGVVLGGTYIEFSPGPLKETGIATDMAVVGEGFFVVARGDEQFLTRAGDFRLSPTGELLTQQGDAVLSDALTPVVLNPALPFQVTPQGEITQGGAVTPLALVEPKSLGDLVKVGERLFTSLSEVDPVARHKRSVESGFLELSGVKPTLEMMELIETTRALEANVNLIRNQDEMIGALITRVLGNS